MGERPGQITGLEFKRSVQQALMGIDDITIHARDSLLYQKPDTWEDRDLPSLEQKRRIVFEPLRTCVNLALFQTFGRHTSGYLVDWGIGEAPYYPLSISGDGLIAIDNSRTALAKCIEQGRIPKNMVMMRQSSPPYDVLSGYSIAGIYGISTFHVLPAPDMEAVLTDLSCRLAARASICHVQELTPGFNFLVNLSEEKLRKMEQYLAYKYGVSAIKPGKISESGGLWGVINRLVDTELRSQKYWIHTKAGASRLAEPGPEIVQSGLDQFDHQTGLRRVTHALKSSSDARPYMKNPTQLERQLNAVQPGIKGVVMANYTLSSVMRCLPSSAFNDSTIFQWVLSHDRAITSFGHDLLEAFLVTTFADLGMDVAPQRVTVLLTDYSLHSELSYSYVDGILALERSPQQKGTVFSIRMVKATKK